MLLGSKMVKHALVTATCVLAVFVFQMLQERLSTVVFVQMTATVLKQTITNVMITSGLGSLRNVAKRLEQN